MENAKLKIKTNNPELAKLKIKTNNPEVIILEEAKNKAFDCDMMIDVIEI